MAARETLAGQQCSPSLVEPERLQGDWDWVGRSACAQQPGKRAGVLQFDQWGSGVSLVVTPWTALTRCEQASARTDGR